MGSGVVDTPGFGDSNGQDAGLIDSTRGTGLRPAPRSLYKVLAGSGTRCDKVWYKM